MLELITLLLGSAMLLAAVLIVVGMRRAEPATAERRAGLLLPERSLQAPENHSPGTVGPLLTSHVDARDVRLILLDLAVRGFLQITVLTDESGRRHDWALRRTTRPVDSTIRSFEEHLLASSFGASGRNSITLGALLTAPGQPLLTAERALTDWLRQLDWFNAEGRTRHSPWGWIGAIVLLLGLLTTAYMLIDWLATADFRGVIGGVFVCAAGVLLASRGRRHSAQTDSGAVARGQAEAYRDTIHDLTEADLDVDQAGASFALLLPWAIAFGGQDQLAKVFDEFARRSANWGRNVELNSDWLVNDRGPESASAADLMAEALAFIQQRPGPRLGRRRVAGAQRER